MSPPTFLDDNTMFLTAMGSDAYGASSGSSDLDIYGFCIPKKSDVFPYTTGNNIWGYGTPPNPFTVYTQHHVIDGEKEYDFTIYSIVKFFSLAHDASPNIVDALFVPRRCIIHTTQIGNLVRDNRKLFISSKLKPRLIGYAYQQLTKLKNGNTPLVQFIREHGLPPEIFGDKGELHLEEVAGFHKIDELVELNKRHPIKVNSKRRADIIKHSYSTKEAYHVVRLALQCEQLLTEGDLDLERNSEILKSIRRGEWSLEKLVTWFEDKERQLEELHSRTTIPYSPDEAAIKELLLRCLEMHYGSISDAIKHEVPVENLISDLQNLIERYKR